MDNFLLPVDQAIDLRWARSYVGMRMNVPRVLVGPMLQATKIPWYNRRI